MNTTTTDRFDFGLTFFGFGCFAAGAAVLRNGRHELKRLGNNPNVNYSVKLHQC